MVDYHLVAYHCHGVEDHRVVGHRAEVVVVVAEEVRREFRIRTASTTTMD